MYIINDKFLPDSLRSVYKRIIQYFSNDPIATY